jgi:hypothetical protein
MFAKGYFNQNTLFIVSGAFKKPLVKSCAFSTTKKEILRNRTEIELQCLCVCACVRACVSTVRRKCDNLAFNYVLFPILHQRVSRYDEFP